MTFPRYYYSRNPLDILIEQENRTCKGCVHEKKYTIANHPFVICLKGKAQGKRCKLYNSGG
jgi:hypothetical protein